jgi:hypothetical protein
MSLFHLVTALPSGIFRAIKALDKKSAMPSHGQGGISKYQPSTSNIDLTNCRPARQIITMRL